ncbi:MAG: glycosyltransferase family 2 protein, partial [candidate division KSB1 bacterium]|nr:glycosyltransferase family 2 protein [candidate division KSB1 bacterium]
MQTILYSIVIPVYNTKESLIELVDRLNAVFSETIRKPFEIIMVDDGSKNPDTWPTLLSLAEKNPHLTVIQLTRNFGQMSALICGLFHSRGDYVITMDDDLQHAPEYIPLLISEQYHDMVVARFPVMHHGPLRRITHKLKEALETPLFGKPRGIELSSFRLLKRQLIDGLREMMIPHPALTYLLLRQTQDVVNVTVPHYPRKEGKSGYSHRRRFSMFMNLLIYYSPVPSTLTAIVGSVFFFGAAGTAIILIFLQMRGLGGTLSFSTWLLVLMLLALGANLTALGLIGHYCFRILQSFVRRTPYAIRRIIGTQLE